MRSAEQLSRTTLLFQGDLGISDPTVVLQALMAPSISLVADDETVNSFAGQVAISTAAMLMARSGHKVFIDAPDAALIGRQPPMKGHTFQEAIASVSNKLIDGVEIEIGRPPRSTDIAFVFGKRVWSSEIRAKRRVSVGWSNWSAELLDRPGNREISARDWPIGAMAAATLVAAESVKLTGLALCQFSDHPSHFLELFAPSRETRLILAPEATPNINKLGEFDIISAGAVSNAFLYSLLRIPRAAGKARVFDRDISDEANRNRNMLLLPEFVGLKKVELFQHFATGIGIAPIRRHLSENDVSALADRIVAGVDDIPTRWVLARATNRWMGVGATSHFSSMASVHYPAAACAACLHPRDEVQDGPTPTIAFVSFLAGLMLAADFLKDIVVTKAVSDSKYRYLTALQTGQPWSSAVAPHPSCPAQCSASRRMAA